MEITSGHVIWPSDDEGRRKAAKPSPKQRLSTRVDPTGSGLYQPDLVPMDVITNDDLFKHIYTKGALDALKDLKEVFTRSSGTRYYKAELLEFLAHAIEHI